MPYTQLASDIAGWTLTGDWRRYLEAPQSQTEGWVIPWPLQGYAFGTDGNRQFPYPCQALGLFGRAYR